MAKAQAAPAQTVSVNRKAFHDYFIEEEYEAGIVLTGSEIKSVRAGRINLRGAYARVENGEAWLFDAHISPYEQSGVYFNHEPTRPRKLLLHRREIDRLLGATAEKGQTIVPTRLYWNGPRAKVELAVAKGKDMYDKRRAIKERDTRREVERALSERY